MTVRRFMVSDEIWFETRYISLGQMGGPDIEWPLPPGRCYEIAELDIIYIFLRASAFRKDEASEEETP